MGKGKREEQERGQEAVRALREHKKKAQVFRDKENIKEKMLPTSISAKRAQSVTL